MLDALDAGSVRGKVYRELVGHPRSRTGALAARTGLPGDVVEAVLAELADEGVVQSVGEAWEANSPAEVTETLLARDTARRADLRRAGIELEQVFRFARRESGQYGPMEVVEDPERILDAMRRLQRSARREVRVVDRPPYYASAQYYGDQEVLQAERMAAGVTYRVIYYESAFDDPVAGPNMARMIAAGEQARTLEDPPVKLCFGDGDLGVVTVAGEGGNGVVGLLVRPSGLLTSLSNVFETLWKLAVPASVSAPDAELDDRDRRILSLMASGATDDAIARRLDLSRRTVVRRTALILERLGATTRFQAGVQASRRGWL